MFSYFLLLPLFSKHMLCAFGIRSSWLMEFKDGMLSHVHSRSQVPFNQPLPMHIFLAWSSTNTARVLANWSAKVLEVVAPFLFIAALISAVLSPIVLL
jgi:hypothetical protein